MPRYSLIQLENWYGAATVESWRRMWSADMEDGLNVTRQALYPFRRAVIRTAKARRTQRILNARLYNERDVRFDCERHRLALLVKLEFAPKIPKDILAFLRHLEQNRDIWVSSSSRGGKFVVLPHFKGFVAFFIAPDGTTRSPRVTGKSPYEALARLCGLKWWFFSRGKWYSLYHLYPSIYFQMDGMENSHRKKPRKNTTRIETKNPGKWAWESWRMFRQQGA